MKLFVGLGNPGSNYEKTRHNIGFRVIDKLIDQYQARKISNTSFKGELYKAGDTLFLKPLTYMNLSGKSVQAVKQFYNIATEDITVIHDDIDLPFGAIRLKKGGGAGGHNGLKSVDQSISNDYIRLRIGVGRPIDRSDVVNYVLEPFSKEQKSHIEDLIEYAAMVSGKLMEEGLESVRSKHTLTAIEQLSQR